MTTFNDLIRGKQPTEAELRADTIREVAAERGWRDPSDAQRLDDGQGEPADAVARMEATRPNFLTPSAQMNRRLRGWPEDEEPQPAASAPSGGSADAGNAGDPTTPFDMGDWLRSEYSRKKYGY